MKEKEGFFKIVNYRSSLGLGLTSAHEACMQCVNLALSERRNASAYYVVLDVESNTQISEELIFSYNIEKVDEVERQKRQYALKAICINYRVGTKKVKKVKKNLKNKHMKNISLYFKEGTSDKEYHVQLNPAGKGFVVNFQYGRVGNTLTPGTKTPLAVSEPEAEKIYEKLVKEKMGKGYRPLEGSIKK